MRIHISLLVLIAGLFAAACAPSAPALPSTDNPAAVSRQITGDGGPQFLREITSFEWSDDGRRAGELLSWIPRDAGSSDPATQARAGTAAHALAAFLADHYNAVKNAGETNPALIQSYAAALIPYLGAMVGDPTGTSGFEPLDRIGSSLQRTALVFAVIENDDTADRDFTGAAKRRAHEYEQHFAELAVADPALSRPDPRREELLQAARLLGLVAAGERLANPKSAEPSPFAPVTNLRYEIVSRMVRGSDPRISPKFFNPNGSLLSPDAVPRGDWSLYDSQLANYLASYPRLTDAIEEFDRTYSSVANR